MINKYFKYHLIRIDRKIKFIILKYKWFYKYSLFLLLILECILSWFTSNINYTWKLYDFLILLLQCSVLFGIREFISCYIHKKCIWQKTASIGLIINSLLELISQECTNEYIYIIKGFSITILTVLTIILIYKSTNYNEPIF